jgi:hypothetical protein
MSGPIINISFEPLYRQPCWGLEFGGYTNLSMNFGQPSLRFREPYQTRAKSQTVREMAASRRVTVRGQWWLWFYYCRWRLISDGQTLVTDASSFRKIGAAIRRLEGQKLVEMLLKPATGATQLKFDLGFELHVRRLDPESDAEIWMLYKPSGYVLSVYGNGTFSHGRSSRARERRGQPIQLGYRMESDLGSEDRHIRRQES